MAEGSGAHTSETSMASTGLNDTVSRTKMPKSALKTISRFDRAPTTSRPLTFDQHCEHLERLHTTGSQPAELDDPEHRNEQIEKAEAEHYGFKVRVKPRSQMGSGGRTPHKTPPWMTPSHVKDALHTMRRGLRPGSEGQKIASSNMLNTLSSGISQYVLPPCFCRTVPWALVRDSFLLGGLRREDMPVVQRSAVCLSLCDMELSDKPLTEMVDASECDVVIGMSVATNVADLSRNMPRLRSLGLCENRLKQVDMQLVGDWLKGNSKLERLILQSNSIDDDGAGFLADGLVSNTVLTCLKLCDNRIGAASHDLSCLCILLCHCVHLRGRAVFVLDTLAGFSIAPTSSIALVA